MAIKHFLRRYWQKLNQVSELDFWHLFMIYLALTDETVMYHFKYVICISAVVGLTLQDQLWQRITCTLHALVLALCLYLYFYTAANHYFAITYFSFYVVFRQYRWVQAQNFGFGLVVLIMALATLQKFLSPHFINGSFSGFLFLSGSSLQPLNEWNFHGFGANIDFFNDQMTTLTSKRVGNQILEVYLPAGFNSWSLLFTWLIIGAELALVAMLIWGKHSYRYWAMLLFLWATVFFRKEYTFFATLSFLLITDKQMEGKAVSGLLKLSFLLFLLFSFLGVMVDG
jgi:hypothetical protein